MTTTGQTEDSLYLRSQFKRDAGKFTPYAPDTFKAFAEFNKLVLQDSALTTRFKELIAIAVAHATGCPYCIDLHVIAGRKLELSQEEIFEAIAVSALVKGFSAFYSGLHTFPAYEAGEPADELYLRSELNKLEQFESINEALYTALLEFRNQVLAPHTVNRKEKAIIAVAISLTTGSAYSIEAFTKLAKEEGATLAEITEATLVATSLKAGSALAHRVNAYLAFVQQ